MMPFMAISAAVLVGLALVAADEFAPPAPKQHPSLARCSPRCRKFNGDGSCDFSCNNADCNFDSGDCKKPATTVTKQNIARDCVGRWSACSSACTRTFRVARQSAHGGRRCKTLDGTIDAKGCKKGQGACGAALNSGGGSSGKNFPQRALGVTCQAQGRQCVRTRARNGKRKIEPASMGKEFLAETFDGIAGHTYTFHLRWMESDEVEAIQGRTPRASRDEVNVAVRLAAAGSLDAQEMQAQAARMFKNDQAQYMYSGALDTTIQWVCPGTGSWSIMLNAKCTTRGQASCVFGVATEITSRDRSTEPGALKCSSAPGTPNRICQGVEVTVSVPVRHNAKDTELQAQLARMFTVSASPTVVVPTQITLAKNNVELQVEMRAANKQSLKELGKCLDTVSTVEQMQHCGEHNALSEKRKEIIAKKPRTCKKLATAPKNIFGRRVLQGSQCSAFCGNGRPCTPPCKSWGCSNCVGDNGGDGGRTSAYGNSGGKGQCPPHSHEASSRVMEDLY